MKDKIIHSLKSALLILIPAIIFISCDSSGSKKNDKIIAVSTITIINDMVKQIAKDKVEAISICSVGSDPHTYKSVPGDSRTIAKADVVFVNGFGLEGWINKLIEAASDKKFVVTVTKSIDPMKDEKGHGDPDPHCWFDANLAKIYTENILEGLIEIDPANEEFYTSNAGEFIKQIDSLHQWTLEKINLIPEEHRILVTSHDAFRYFGRAYGIRVEALQGISTEAKVQTADVARLVDLIIKINLPAVFIETSVNPKLLQQIALETNAVIGGTLFSDSIGNEGTPGGSYIGAFRQNVETVTNALTQKSISQL